VSQPLTRAARETPAIRIEKVSRDSLPITRIACHELLLSRLADPARRNSCRVSGGRRSRRLARVCDSVDIVRYQGPRDEQ